MTKTRTLASGILREQFEIGETRETVLGEICPSARKRFPFYFKLPYDKPVKLLRWRVYCRKRCRTDKKFRRMIWGMCRRDPAFFAVTFLAIFEPRPFPHRLPFHLWTDQVSLLSWFEEIFGRRGGAVDKTRGIGVSWLTTAFIYHKWTFVKDCPIAVVSEDASKLTSKDSNSLLGKLQYYHDNMPNWAKYTKSGRNKLYRVAEDMSFVNLENRAIVQGYVSREAKLRGDRFSMIFADEFGFYKRSNQDEWITAATGTTDCLLMVSTWNSFEDMFEHIMYGPPDSTLRMKAFWWNNHERWQGAYYMDRGNVVRVDKTFRHVPDYKFGQPDVLDDGVLRSPWIDSEMAKPGKNRDILTALRDLFGRSVCEQTNSFFTRTLKDAVKLSVRDPQVIGNLDTAAGKVVIHPTNQGGLWIWEGVPEENRGPYTMGLDTAEGVGAAFSVANVIDREGKQVLEYGRNDLGLAEFIADAVALARWLAGDEGDGWVKIDFEANGRYVKFVDAELKRHGYANVHLSDYAASSKAKEDKYAGTVNRDKGLANFKELERAILSLETRVHSSRVAEDIRLLGRDGNGLPEFPRGQKCGHGDFLHAYAIAWWRARSSITPEKPIESIEGDSASEPVETGFKSQPKWSDNWK